MNEKTLDEIMEEVQALPDGALVVAFTQDPLQWHPHILTVADLKRLVLAIELGREHAAQAPQYRQPEYLDEETKRRRGIDRSERVVRR